MAKEKTTIQDIADALGISRNTASKALNGTSAIPEETRTKVIEKAIELKYKQFAFMDSSTLFSKSTGNIALLTANLPKSSHFGSRLISGLEKHIRAQGYTLSFHIVRDIDQEQLVLPNNLDPANVDGIVCIELFDLNYSTLVMNLGIPTIFVDCPANVNFSEWKADLLMMENQHSVYHLTSILIENGYTKLGFAGDYQHCLSFNERWLGFQKALTAAGISLDTSQCIQGDDSFFFEPDWIEEQLKKMTDLPSVFICANDFTAINVMKALKNMNISVPDQVAICGFDNGPETSIVDPQLTSIHIHSDEMGIKAAELLLSRIQNPTQPHQVSYVFTKPLIRASTPLLHK